MIQDAKDLPACTQICACMGIGKTNMATVSSDKSMQNQEHKDKSLAREKLLRAKFYRVMAIGCALGGILISAYIFEILGRGNPEYIIRNPVIVGLLLLPFVPAAFMAILSKSRRAQAVKLLEPYYKAMSAAEVRRMKEE